MPWQTTPTSVDVKKLTAPFTAGASWSTRTGSAAWATPGGDRGAAVARATVSPAAGGNQQFNVSASVQRWLDGSSPFYGFELEKTAAAAGG